MNPTTTARFASRPVLLVLALAGVASPAAAQLDPTDVLFNDPANVDTATAYKNVGTVSTGRANDDKPMNGEMEQIPGVNWNFWVGFSATMIKDNGDAQKAILRLSGKHAAAPHGDDAPSNDLPEISTKPVDVSAGKSKTGLAVWAGDVHPAKHFDYYAVAADVTNVTLGATTSLTSGNCVVGARHSEKLLGGNNDKPYDIPKDMFTIGSLDMLASYDAQTRTVTFAPAPVGILDAAGGQSFGVDPQFAGDLALKGVVVLSPVQVADAPNGDGTYAASGGKVQVVDADGRFSLDAAFAEMLMAPMGDPATLGSCAQLVGGTIVAGDDGEASVFLRQFGEANVVGLEVPDWDHRTIALSIHGLDGSLLEWTNGFEQSCEGVPLIVTIGGTAPFEGGPDCAADFNGDGVLNIQDFYAFRQAWGSKDASADLNGDGEWTFADYLVFRNLYAQGCD